MDNNKKVCSIIYFLIKNSKNLGKTKLVKLMYLADYEFFKCFGDKISNIDYIRWDFGPFSPDIYDYLDFMKDTGIITMHNFTSFYKSREYCSFKVKGVFDIDRILSPDEIDFLDYILSKYDDMDLDAIKKITYETEPMLKATDKGELLKFENIDKVISMKLKNLGKKIETLKDYKGKPFDSKDSPIGDDLVNYQYDLASE